MAVNLDPYIQQSRRNSDDSVCSRQVSSSVQTDVMAAVAQLNQAQMQEAAQEYYNFVMTFRDLGAGGSVTVSDVYRRMRERGLPTGYIDPYICG